MDWTLALTKEPDAGRRALNGISEQIVRCPYCVLGNEFRPMLRRPQGRAGSRLENWFVCMVCGHKATPGAQHSSCACAKCQEMDRIAIRCRTSGEFQRSLPIDLPRPAAH